MFGFGQHFDPLGLLITFVIIILSIAFHEACHALVAYKLGDSTPKYLGRLTLNPIAHLDPLGTIMILVTMLGGLGIGWGKPVQVNPYNLRNGPKNGMAMVSIAGPLSNLALAAALAVPLRSPEILQTPMLASAIATAVFLNLTLAIFNLIPLPPLDGFKVLQGILPNRQAYALSSLETYGPAFLLLIIFVGPYFHINILGMIIGPIGNFLFSMLIGGH